MGPKFLFEIKRKFEIWRFEIEREKIRLESMEMSKGQRKLFEIERSSR